MKHAFLIIAHHQFEILSKMLRILDNNKVDFFILIDKKTGDFPRLQLEESCTNSKIYFTDRMSVYWGGYSQVECTLRLLDAAAKGNYDYYHLLSGADFPVKSNDYILNYFEQNPPYQYVHFERKTVQDKYVDRLRYHSFFQDTRHKFLKQVDRVIRRAERAFGYSRLKNNPIKEFQYGSQWFSITHSFATYILNQKEWIHDTFKDTLCCDELFVQTLLVNSPFKNEVVPCAFDDNYEACLRAIDWKRGDRKEGHPYIWQNSDYESLIRSPYLFARKFDLSVDSNIIDLLYEYCKL